MQMATATDIIGFIVAVAIPLGLGFAGAYFFGGANSAWYEQLNKPSWTPPDYAFPIIWTILYILLGISSWLVWRNGGFSRNGLALGIYALQLVLNFLWTPLFFSLHRPAVAFAEIVLLWISIVATIYLFYQSNRLAAYLLIPYLLWVTLAAALNLNIWLNNPPDGQNSPAGGYTITEPLTRGGAQA